MGPPAAHSRWPLILVLLVGLALQLPGLGVGFFADDYVQRLALTDETGLVPTPRWNLFDFGDLEGWRDFARERNPFPWWTDPDWKVRFFRPLASASIRLDDWLWSGSALAAHATSLALFALLLGLSHALFRRLGLSPRAALTALLVLACSDSSSIPVGWLANRNALLEALFAVGALLVAGSGPARPGRVLAALALATAAALSKESGCFAFLVLALYWSPATAPGAAGGAPPGPARGARPAAWAATAGFLGWLTLLALGGYGTRSLFYATPWLDPLRFGNNLLLLATGGALTLLGPFPLDLATAFPVARPLLIGAGLLLGWPALTWIWRSAARHPAARLAAAWILLFGLPQAGTIGADRLLFVSSIGFAALFGLFWEAESERARTSGSSRLRSLTARALLLLVTLGSGAMLLVQNRNLAEMSSFLRQRALETEVGAPELGRRELIVLQTESQMQAFSLGATWHGESADHELCFDLLQFGGRPLRWTRLDAHTCELESLGTPFGTGVFESVYRTRAGWPAEGQILEQPLGTVQPLDIGPRGPQRLRLRLALELDDPRVRFLRPVAGVLRRIAPPAIGASLELAAPVRAGPFMP